MGNLSHRMRVQGSILVPMHPMCFPNKRTARTVIPAHAWDAGSSNLQPKHSCFVSLAQHAVAVVQAEAARTHWATARLQTINHDLPGPHDGRCRQT